MDEVKGKTVLIVDDDPDYADTLADQFTAIGMIVVGIAKNGAEAIALAAEKKPDLIVMDIDFRGHDGPDGLETTRIIKEKNPTAIMVLSGHYSSEHITRARLAGVTTYLAKPQTLDQLRPSIVLTINTHKDVQDLIARIHELESDLVNRKTIEQAKGILMEKKEMSEKDAYEYMRSLSQKENKPMVEIARMILLFKGLL